MVSAQSGPHICTSWSAVTCLGLLNVHLSMSGPAMVPWFTKSLPGMEIVPEMYRTAKLDDVNAPT